MSTREEEFLQRLRATFKLEAEEQRQRLQTILDVLPTGVALVEGPEGRVTVLNPAGRAIWGDQIASHPIDSMYSTAATKPASSSCGSVPVSNR